MEKHTVPQNITGFEFKLVGFLTLKQFGYVGGAGVLSFILFLSVPGILKWVFIVPIMLLGLAFAFLPINGMTFDRWIFVFARAIINPSRRIWKKESKAIAVFGPEFAGYLKRSIQNKGKPIPDRKKLNLLLTQIREREGADKLDLVETRLGKIKFSREAQPLAAAEQTSTQEARK